MKQEKKLENKEAPKFVEGVDYYFENGLMVLSEHLSKKARLLLRQRLSSLPVSESGNFGVKVKKFPILRAVHTTHLLRVDMFGFGAREIVTGTLICEAQHQI